ncbi:hypothetical protein OG767_02920 [Micromonospora sp. NBC_01392]|uniref:hypothetical protein n=1 Tax=Micromonospora sp. NBC_01392 TaxID=2903588 RepID=UPI00324F19D8
MPAPPFPPPPAMAGVPGAQPVWPPTSAPPAPAVPAPPTWPPPAASARQTETTPPVRPQLGSQDLAGTAYGGTEGPGFATVALPQSSPSENTGSLTGHILAQGWAEDTPATRASNTKVIIVLAVALTALIAISLLVVFLANDALSGLTGTVLMR